MTAQVFLWSIRILAWLSLLVWLAVLVLVDPKTSRWLGLSFFYFSLFLAVSSWSFLFLNWLRKIFLSEEESLKKINISFREGIIAGLLSITLLWLQSQSYLNWWVAGLVLAGFLLWELYFAWIA